MYIFKDNELGDYRAILNDNTSSQTAGSLGDLVVTIRNYGFQHSVFGVDYDGLTPDKFDDILLRQSDILTEHELIYIVYLSNPLDSLLNEYPEVGIWISEII